MDNNQGNYTIFQNLEIIPPQKIKAYTVDVKDWEFLKGKINEIKITVNGFYSIGFLLLGASISSLITIFATDFQDDASKYLTWTFFAVSLLGGLLSTCFARDKHKQENAKPKDIIAQMKLIEDKLETSSGISAL